MAKRILVVEDNDLNRKLFCDVLKVNGYEVVPVADGQNVLATAQRFVPQLVIMDIQLPNVSGVDLIAQLKRDPVTRPVPVLAVTAYAGKGDEERIRDAGADIAPEPLVADHKETPNAAGDQGRRQPRKQRRTHDILQHHRA